MNINVNNYNHITGGNIGGATQWQHNPAYRGGVPYHDPATSQKFISGATQANVGAARPKKSILVHCILKTETRRFYPVRLTHLQARI